MASRFIGELPDDLVKFEKTRPLGERFSGSISGRAGLNQDYDGIDEVDSAPQGAQSFFNVGDRVVHATFGEGVITGVERGVTVAVRFSADGSERKLMVTYAPLRKA